MNFDKLGLSDSLLKAVKIAGYTKPTQIQEKAITAILSGKDVMAAAQTGTGKTAGFTLPLLQLRIVFTICSNDFPMLDFSFFKEINSSLITSLAIFNTFLSFILV